MCRLIVFCIAFLSAFAYAIPSDHGVDYDIVYVRYPGEVNPQPVTEWPWPNGFSTLPQGEKAYDIEPGADLMLLHPNGTEEILVDCDATCSVMDPYISYDATHVYYSKMTGLIDGDSDTNRKSAGHIYKINLAGGSPYTEIQLTYTGSFDSLKHASNTVSADGMGSFTNIRDMAPVPLSDGRLLFTSNRHGNMGFNQDTNPVRNSVQAMYTMDDHDGTANTVELANISRLEFSGMSMVQHPMQLKDGRILFSTWQDFGDKYLSYAMTPLFTMYPDGSNLQQFTEAHDQHKNVEHFITQLSTGDIVVDWYYPSFDFGFGALLRYELDPAGQDHLRNPPSGAFWDFSTSRTFHRMFHRVGTDYITPHTTPKDSPAPNGSGKYSMPSWAKSGNMLVAYSPGHVNHFDSNCNAYISSPLTKLPCQNLKSGIYLFKNAETGSVTDPTDTAQLAPMIDADGYNEIWPRAVVPYVDVFGVSAPAVIPSVRKTVNSKRIAKGEMAAIVGTSSTLNREAKTDYTDAISPDGPYLPRDSRETTDGNFSIVGTEIGLFEDAEVFGVRILTTPETPYTGIDKPSTLRDYTQADRNQNNYAICSPSTCKVWHGYGSTHNEQWRILGEFPFAHTSVTDLQGNADTSWQAKIPANTPTTIQAIDANGMTLYSETTWRSMAPGEERTDCGGCHAHSTEVTKLDFDTTETGKGTPITGITGVSDDDARIQYSMWDLTTAETPIIGENGAVTWVAGRDVGYEYHDDIEPIIQSRCLGCHVDGQSNGGLTLDTDAWLKLTNKNSLIDASYAKRQPQMSKYIRSPQARNSLLVWIAWDQRLDGRDNSSRDDDTDYPAHPALNLPHAEKSAISRWVDLGAPINFEDIAPEVMDGIGYTDDNQLPVIDIYSPSAGSSPVNRKIRMGIFDAKSEIDWATLSITYYDVSSPGTVVTIPSYNRDTLGVVTADMPVGISAGNDYVIKVSVSDVAGNTQDFARRFTAAAASVRPSQALGVTKQ